MVDGGRGGGTLPQVNSDYVHRDEIGETVSRILLKGFQKLQITRLFSIPFIITLKWIEYKSVEGWGTMSWIRTPPPPLPNIEFFT